MTVNDRRYQRLLAWEVLVERTDTDAGHLGNPVGARPVIAFLDQNASSRFQKRVDRWPRPFLRGRVSWICLQFLRHMHVPGMRVYNMSDHLYFIHHENASHDDVHTSR